jgi:hypothetical protein
MLVPEYQGELHVRDRGAVHTAGFFNAPVAMEARAWDCSLAMIVFLPGSGSKAGCCGRDATLHGLGQVRGLLVLSPTKLATYPFAAWTKRTGLCR